MERENSPAPPQRGPLGSTLSPLVLTLACYNKPMDDILNFLKFMAILIAVLIVVFLVLLALPKSRLRQSILKIYSIVALVSTILSVIYIISPIDAIPDFIPIAGQSDDLVAAISALATAITSYISWQKSKENIKDLTTRQHKQSQ